MITDENKGQIVRVIYTNHRGEASTRKILPIRMWFGESEWHPNVKQHFLKAWDVEKEAERDFAMCEITAWLTITF
jgi:predicted DNA-binding transcriptional regulator YafY